MSENICGQREACNVCGSTVWTDAHYTAGVLVCAACCAEIRRASRSARVHSAPKQTTLAEWLAPQRKAAP